MPRRTESAHGFRAITLCVVFLSLSVCFTEQAEGQGPDPAQVRQDYNHSVIIATEAHHQPGVFWAESTPPWTHSPYSPTGWVINPTTQRQRAIQIHSMADKITQIVNSAAITNELTGERGNAQFVEQRAAGGLQARSDLLLYKGARLMSKGAFEQAIEFYRQALISLEDKDRDKEGALYTQLGWASQAVGDLQGALSAYESALSAYGEKKNNSAKATTHLLIGSLYQSVGESMKAKDSYESALEEAQSDELRTAALASLGDLLQSIDTDESLTRYQQALTIVSKGSAWEASILAGIGRCWMEQSFKGNALVGPSNERVGEWVVDANGTHWKAIQKPNAIDDSLVEQIELTFAEAHASAKVSGNRSAEAGVLANIGEL